jgi:hypothetical protein
MRRPSTGYEPGTGAGLANVPFYEPDPKGIRLACHYGQEIGSSSIRNVAGVTGPSFGATNTA